MHIMSALLILLLLISCTAANASYFDCSAKDSCHSTVMDCIDGAPCFVNCTGENSCAKNTFIYGNAATNLTVKCDRKNACNQVQVSCGIITGQCLLDCKETFENTDYDNVCKDEDLFCGPSQCSINCGAYKACGGANSAITINSSTTASFQCSGIKCPVSFTLIEFTQSPTQNPTSSTLSPTASTINPTNFPTNNPSLGPTNNPSLEPTNNPTLEPTNNPTVSPTNNPSISPITNTPTTNNPTSLQPTYNPTVISTDSLSSLNPTQRPTKTPTERPTQSPFSIDTTTTKSTYLSTETTNLLYVSKLNELQESFITMDYFIIIAICVGGVFCVLGLGCCFFIFLYYKNQQKRIIVAMSVDPKVSDFIAQLSTNMKHTNTNTTMAETDRESEREPEMNKTCIDMEETEEETEEELKEDSSSSTSSSSSVSSSSISRIHDTGKMEGANSQNADNTFFTDYVNNGYTPQIPQIHKIDTMSFASSSMIYQPPPAIVSDIHSQVNSITHDEIQVIELGQRRRRHSYRISDVTHVTDMTIPNIPDDM